MDRITRLASLTKGSVCVCDIGCDHAYALIKSIKEYGVLKGIASEVAKGPLENAIKSIKEAHLEDVISTYLSDGFKNIDLDFDTAIIAGMGGALICDILAASIDKIKGKKLILEANCESYRIREFLCRNGFKIDYEDAFYDQGKYYEIMVFTTGIMNMDCLDIKYGPYLRRSNNTAFLSHYNDKINLLEGIIDKINNNFKKEEKIKELIELRSLINYPNMEKYFLLNTTNYYRTYFIDNTTRPTIFIAPGGGYKYTSARESEPVVKIFNKLGYHCIVVNYRENEEEVYPMPGTYLAHALKEIKKDARVGKVIGLGFSAGGHAILELALHYKDYSAPKMDLLMLGYPVVTADKRYAHLGSFEVLLKEKSEDPILRNYLSLETQVNEENVVDLFLWGTYTDESVSVMNSLLLIEGYRKCFGNVEYHMFHFGGHGLSVANEETALGDENKKSPYIARWTDFANEWILKKIEK